jgi:hypothetical protein
MPDEPLLAVDQLLASDARGDRTGGGADVSEPGSQIEGGFERRAGRPDCLLGHACVLDLRLEGEEL